MFCRLLPLSCYIFQELEAKAADIQLKSSFCIKLQSYFHSVQKMNLGSTLCAKNIHLFFIKA